MALTDVVEALTDPDFCDQFTYIPTTISVGEDGIGTGSSPGPITVTGVITAGSGDRLIRAAEGEYQEGTITVHCSVPFTTGHVPRTADIIIWREAEYTVTKVSNYMNFGQGFVRVECELIPLGGAAS